MRRLNECWWVIAICLFMVAGMPEAWAGDDPATFRTFWKDGVRMETADKQFVAKIGGRILNDWAFFFNDGAVKARQGGLADGTEFRTARLFMAGELYRHVEFKAQYDFAAGAGSFKDVYLGVTGIPYVGNVRVGQFKEPFSLEELTSSNYVTFMERGLPNALAPGRNTGIMLHRPILGERMTLAGGVFRTVNAFGDGTGGSSEYNLTGRITGLPWYDEDGARLVHVGLGVSRRSPAGDLVRLRSRPESHLASFFTDTVNRAVTLGELLGGEAALVYGPLSVQGEYVLAREHQTAAEKAHFHSYYAMASYFLTGEHRAYKNAEGAFTRVKPKRNLFDGGPGAWEVAARFSALDLNDAGIPGGRMQDVTGGVNWHLNPNMRIMTNYVLSNLSTVGKAHIAQMRFQVDF